MKISIAQFKSTLGVVAENFSTAARLIEAARGSDVILLPELWSTGYYPTPVKDFADINGIKTKEFLCAAAQKFSVNIIGGSVIVQSGGKIFNRCHVVNRRGEVVRIKFSMWAIKFLSWSWMEFVAAWRFAMICVFPNS